MTSGDKMPSKREPCNLRVTRPRERNLLSTTAKKPSLPDRS
ncbi:hypothetical protein M3J09_002342 [Ascochyta lentis]